MHIETIQITSAAELDALVGQHVAGDEPEIYWEDSHGHFQFETEAEARRALFNPYYQRFLPEVDWEKTVVREVHAYRHYCADPVLAWRVVEKATARWGPLALWKEEGRWSAEFGSSAAAHARTAQVAICLAALRAAGFRLEVEHDRVDAQVSHYALIMQMRLEGAEAGGADEEEDGEGEARGMR